MLMAITVLGVFMVVLLAFIAVLLREIRFAIHLVSQQLEYFGAPFIVENGVLFAARKLSEK